METNAQMEFWEKKVWEIYRKTVIGVLYSPSTDEFFYCDRPEYGLCCLISWWVEKWESYEDALVREVREETGMIDCKIIWKLWWNILTHYFMSKKNEFRVKDIEAYLVYVDPSTKVSNSLEPDETFCIRSVWYTTLLGLMSSYNNPIWWWLEDHIEILKRAGKVIYKK